MKSRPQSQQSETLVEQARRVMRESREVLEERQAQNDNVFSSKGAWTRYIADESKQAQKLIHEHMQRPQ